jgi:hypothetical protein
LFGDDSRLGIFKTDTEEVVVVMAVAPNAATAVLLLIESVGTEG